MVDVVAGPEGGEDLLVRALKDLFFLAAVDAVFVLAAVPPEPATEAVEGERATEGKVPLRRGVEVASTAMEW